MVHPLYWIITLIYAIVSSIFLYSIKIIKVKNKKINQAYILLFSWVTFFFLQDALWGLTAGHVIQSDKLLFISSLVFHLSTILTCAFWLNFVLAYFTDKVVIQKLFRIIMALMIFLHIVLLIGNCFTPVIFSIDQNGYYCTAPLRPIAFLNQYSAFCLIALLAGIMLLHEKGVNRKKYLAVFVFVLSPVFFCFFQLTYPEAPFHSIGYFVGCVIIHVFVVSKDHEEQLVLAFSTDKMTGLYNRSVFEKCFVNKSIVTLDSLFIYISFDVNGLKVCNDNLGHAAGDELIKASASIITDVFGKYGNLYRTGGDEFVAMLSVDHDTFQNLLKEFDKKVADFKGILAPKLNISYGYAFYKESPDSSLIDLARLADEKMYKAKALFYKNGAMDRRGDKTKFAALPDSYLKILKVNLTSNNYTILEMPENEKNSTYGFDAKISEWLVNFGNSDMIHPEDLAIYTKKTELEYLRNYFKQGIPSFNLYYRRKVNGVYKNVIMEMVPTQEYTSTNQIVFLYLREYK